MEKVDFELREIPDWDCTLSCTITALCAITGLSPAGIGTALASAAKSNGVCIGDQLRTNYHPDHWKLALIDLGAVYRLALDKRHSEFGERPTISDYLSQISGDDLTLVYCDFVRSNGGRIGHVFAHQGKRLVDTYTGGKIVDDSLVPTEFGDLRVAYSLKVQNKEKIV